MENERRYVSKDNLLMYDALFKIFMQESLDNKVFVGTRTAYNTAYEEGKIQNGALIIITEEDDITDDNLTTAILGSAILGKMILGNP